MDWMRNAAYLFVTSFGTCDCTHTCHVYIATMNTCLAHVHYCGALGLALEVSLHMAMPCA